MFRNILKWGAISLGVLIVLGALIGDSESTTPTTDTAQAETKPSIPTGDDGGAHAKATREKAVEKVDKAMDDLDKAVKPEPKPSMTRGQENALESAEGYLDSGSFSAKGLAEQLRYEEYDAADVRYAVNHVHANYNTEAVEAAESYLDSGSFSRSSLAEQLDYEKYTPAQVAQAVEKAYR